MRSLHIPQLPSTLALKDLVCAEKFENKNIERNKIPDFMIVFILVNFNLIDNADSSTSSE